MSDEISTLSTPPLRRVGAAEGAIHAAAFAAAFVLLGRVFEGGLAFAVPPAAGLCWLGWYAALRVARVRDWFGHWDALSFLFVAAYAVVFALGAQMMLQRCA